MALDALVKVEITAHNSIMDDLLKALQEHSIIQIDPHQIKEWESEKGIIEKTTERIADMKKELIDVEKSLQFLKDYEPKVPLLKKLSMQPDEVSKDELESIVLNKNAKELMDNVLEIEKEILSRESSIKDLEQRKDELLPIAGFQVPLSLLSSKEKTGIVISKLEKEAFDLLAKTDASELIYIEKISGEENIYFSAVFHKGVEEKFEQLEKDFHFEPLTFPDISQTPQSLIKEYTRKIDELSSEKEEFKEKAVKIATQATILRYYYDYLVTELEKDSTKERLFFTESTFVMNGWMKKSDYPVLSGVVSRYREATVQEIEKEEEEVPPIVYKNNRIVSPFEIIVNLYSPPNHKEVDPTPILMPFYALFFGICLTEAGYGLVIALLCLLGLILLKPRNGIRKFLNLFLILGVSTFVIGALIGTVFGINFDMLPENLAWLREARYRIMIFDSSKDVLTFFALSLALGVIHLIAGYIIKIYMLIRSGDWVEAVCDHLPWIFILMAPAPKVLIRFMPDKEPFLNIIFFVLLALWAGIIVLFSERSSFNPIKRIGKGLFTLYGVSGVLGDVLSYSRLLALGLATGVIAGVMNTLSKMVRQLPIVGIVGFVGVLIVGHLFNLFISGLSAFVHSIRLQFMEFFTKFYTGEGEILTAFSEKRKYTYVKTIR